MDFSAVNSTTVVNEMLQYLHSIDRKRVDRFGPVLVEVLASLVIEMANYCKKQGNLLSDVSAFNTLNDDWTHAFLSIYESLAIAEAKQGYKKDSLSKTVKNFLHFLDEWRDQTATGPEFRIKPEM
jgi:hypothetical protein